MPITASTTSRARLIVFLTLVFFVCFWVRYALNAQGRELWMDETDGIFQTVERSWGLLFLKGATPGQANTSPLHYILDKTWLAAWDYTPQLYWDLRVFFRLIPSALWALASAAVFAFLAFWLPRRFPGAKTWQVLIAAAGAAFFYYDNSYLHIFAIEDRSYSLWLCLSTLHFLILWKRLEDGYTRALAAAHVAVCFLLAFSTYASLFQIYAGAASVLLRDWIANRKLAKPREYRYDAAGLGVATIVGFYYFLNMAKIYFPKPALELYFESIREILLKAFHHHGAEPAFVTFPLAFALMPWLLRKRPEYVSVYVFALMNIGLTLVMFGFSWINGGIYHSRYAIFLLPTLTWAYIAMLGYLLGYLLRFARARLPARIPVPSLIALLTLLGAIQVFGTSKTMWKNIRTQTMETERSFIYGISPLPAACRGPLPYQPADFTRLNEICRGFVSP